MVAVWFKIRKGLRGSYDMEFKSILIADTTREERERIVAESIGNINGSCDGCMAGLIDMYQAYIDGAKEIKDINMEFRANYVSGDDDPEKNRMRICGLE